MLLKRHEMSVSTLKEQQKSAELVFIVKSEFGLK